MRNRISHILKSDKAHPRERGSKLPARRQPNPYAAFATATLLGVAIVVTLRALFGGPSARA